MFLDRQDVLKEEDRRYFADFECVSSAPNLPILASSEVFEAREPSRSDPWTKASTESCISSANGIPKPIASAMDFKGL